MDDTGLHRRVLEATRKTRQTAGQRTGWDFMGYVGAALVTKHGSVFTGINLHLLCGIGFCAEYSAVAEMVKNAETVIAKSVATTADGAILPPCGRSRELMYQTTN